jgi:hypothetical protein
MLAEEGEQLAPAIHCLLCGLGIADHLGVGNAAVDAHFGGDVVRMTASACTPALGPFLWDRDCF